MSFEENNLVKSTIPRRCEQTCLKGPMVVALGPVLFPDMATKRGHRWQLPLVSGKIHCVGCIQSADYASGSLSHGCLMARGHAHRGTWPTSMAPTLKRPMTAAILVKDHKMRYTVAALSVQPKGNSDNRTIHLL